MTTTMSKYHSTELAYDSAYGSPHLTFEQKRALHRTGRRGVPLITAADARSRGRARDEAPDIDDPEGERERPKITEAELEMLLDVFAKMPEAEKQACMQALKDNFDLPEEDPEDGESEAGSSIGAMDAKAAKSFFERYPEARRIKIDMSGIQPPPKQQPAMDAAATENFYRMYPEARRIKFG